MIIRNQKLGSLLVSFAFLAACQAQQKPQDEAVSSQDASPTEHAQVETSEGVVGPDEAFFAEYYLEQVFHYSRENTSPVIESINPLNIAQSGVSAFDFNANFTEHRVQL